MCTDDVWDIQCVPFTPTSPQTTSSSDVSNNIDHHHKYVQTPINIVKQNKLESFLYVDIDMVPVIT